MNFYIAIVLVPLITLIVWLLFGLLSFLLICYLAKHDKFACDFFGVGDFINVSFEQIAFERFKDFSNKNLVFGPMVVLIICSYFVSKLLTFIGENVLHNFQKKSKSFFESKLTNMFAELRKNNGAKNE